MILTSCNDNKYVGEWNSTKNNGIITLIINDDGKCLVSESRINRKNRKNRKFENGQWEYNDDQSITLSFGGIILKGSLTEKELLQIYEIGEGKKFYLKKK